jgi:hypothetical protein
VLNTLFYNELITRIVPEVVQIVAEPKGVDVKESTSQGSVPKQKKQVFFLER